LRDAVELEWAGIPSVPLIHEAVKGSAEAMAKLSGVPDYPFVIAHYPYAPIAVWSDEEIQTLARELAPAVRALLTRGT
jgi:hypothetical protein